MWTQIRTLLIIVMTMLLEFSIAPHLSAHHGMHGDRFGMKMIHAPFWKNLSEVQKTELQQIIQALKDQGKDRDTIHVTIMSKLAEWGIERPSRFHIMKRLGDQLTEEQQAELQNLLDQLKDQNASHAEIRKAVHDQLDAWGIERPEPPERPEHHDAQHMNGMKSPKLNCVAQPNPFNPETNIHYELQEPANVKITIFNTQGQVVRHLSYGVQQAGQHQIRWDGKLENGTIAPTGTYIYKIQAGGQCFSGHLLLMK